MKDLPAHRQPWSLLPELSQLFGGFPTWAGRWPLVEGHLIHLEDLMEDGRYVIRAELPGIDPEKDVDITVSNGQLTIKAERTETTATKGRSEFSYGSFVRSVALPPGADDEDITATYDKGILTVSVAISEPPPPVEKRITVQAGD